MLEGGGVGGQRMKLEGSEWAGKEQTTANVAQCCGDTSWLVSRIIIFVLIWQQVTKHDLSTLHVRNELN
jgi:hypothetical protein